LFFKMKSIAAVLVVLVASLFVGHAGETRSIQKPKPDLSGTWKLDSHKRIDGKVIKETTDTLLVVQQLEPEIKFIEDQGGVSEQVLIYFSDGRGEDNPSGLSFNFASREPDPAQFEEKVRTKTKWDGDKLVARALLRRVVNGHTLTYEIIKEWKLSKDRNSLTVTTRRINKNATGIEVRGPGLLRPDMPIETKEVYLRRT